MCGIAGIWEPTKPEVIEPMVEAMRHRGPDDRGTYSDSKITLGMTRLSIIDVRDCGHQPMSTADGKIWIVYNGELYNYREERKTLESLGYSFISESDTEVVLRLYEHYGDAFLARLRGMFAIAIYDRRKGQGQEKLLLARDQIGIKPLLYIKKKNSLIFASEMKAILASGLVPPVVDPEGLRLLLSSGSLFQPRTLIQDVQMLLPAHCMILESGKPERIERYWSLGVDKFPGVRNLPYEKQVSVVDAALTRVVKSQMISDVPLGAFLSGGIDSSIIVSKIASLSDKRVKTFSVGFEREASHIDESDDARRMAEFIGTDHSHVLVQGKDVADQIRNIARSLDQPSVDGVNSYFVSLAARKSVTVSVSGTGGDEIFAGYPWFIAMEQYRIAQKSRSFRFYAQPYYAKKLLGRATSIFRGKRSAEERCEDGFLDYYASNYNIFGTEGASALLAQKTRDAAYPGREMCVDLKTIDEIPDGSALERVSGLCLRGYTCNQLLRDIDAVSMGCSLEVRVPYLDTDLVDLSLSLPDSAKLGVPAMSASASREIYRRSGAKRILIDVGRPLLPKDFDLQPKRGFGMPFDSWLKGPLNATMNDTLADDQVRGREWLSVDMVRKTKKRFSEGKTGWSQPWLLMMLELWSREILDPARELWKEG